MIPARAREAVLPATVRDVLAAALDPTSYRTIAARVKYPVAAVLVSYSLLNLGITAVLSQLLGSERFGEFAVVITIAGIFRLLASMSMESGVAKFIAESGHQSQSEMKAYYAAGLATRLVGGTYSLLLAVLLSGWVARLYHVPHLAHAVVAASLYLCLLWPLATFFLACVQGREQPVRWATGTLINASLVCPAGVIGAIGIPRWGLTGLLLWMGAGWAAAALASAIAARRALGFLLARPDWAHLRVFIPFLLPLWLGDLIAFGTHILLKSYLAVKTGPVATGQFEICLTLLFQVGTLYQAMMIVFLPIWARLYAQQQGAALLASFNAMRGVVVGMASACGLVLALGGQWVIPLLFGREQVGAIAAARVMGLVMPLTFLSWLTLSTFVISNRTALSARANLLWCSVVVPAGLLLIPSLGSLGGSVAFLLGYIVFTWYVVAKARPFFAALHRWERREREGTA